MKINQSETACDTYHDHVLPHLVSRQQQFILDCMKRWQLADYSIGELAHITKMDKSTISGRRFEMLKAGLIVRGQKRKCLFSDRVVETVKLTEGI